MKANRKFVNGDEAVSPVIAVILMVAITVVLAATVFVLVSDIGSKSSQNAPNVSFNTDDPNDKLSVSQAATQADWNRLAIRVASLGGYTTLRVGGAAVPHQNAAGTTAAGSALLSTTANVAAASASAPISASDFLQFCSTGTGQNAQISIIDTVATQTLGTYTFSSVTNCA